MQGCIDWVVDSDDYKSLMYYSNYEINGYDYDDYYYDYDYDYDRSNKKTSETTAKKKNKKSG